MVALLVIISGVITIGTKITSHILTCKKFATIRKAFPKSTIEETVKATVELSSIDRKGK